MNKKLSMAVKSQSYVSFLFFLVILFVIYFRIFAFSSRPVTPGSTSVLSAFEYDAFVDIASRRDVSTYHGACTARSLEAFWTLRPKLSQIFYVNSSAALVLIPVPGYLAYCGPPASPSYQRRSHQTHDEPTTQRTAA